VSAGDSEPIRQRSLLKRRTRRLVAVAAALVALVGVVVAFDAAQVARLVRSQMWSLGVLHLAEYERKLPARLPTERHIGIGAGLLLPEADAPLINPESAFYPGPIEVTVSKRHEADAVHCSRDGSIPTTDHDEYTGGLTFAASGVLRCRAFRSGHQGSPTATATFLIGVEGSLPALAMTVDPTGLWNPYTGIYAQWAARGSEWKRDADVALIPRAPAAPFSIHGQVRISGESTRSSPKKSFRFEFKPLSSDAVVASNILTWPSLAPERAVIFGTISRSSGHRDELFQTLFTRAGGLTGDNFPVFLHLNAEPWGLYYVKERIDEDYLQRHFGGGSYDLLEIVPGTPNVVLGDLREWRELMTFLAQNNLADDAAFAAMSELIDVDNFTLLWLFNIYAGNADWPHHYMFMFRSRTGTSVAADGRWRWIAWDMDAAFNLQDFGLNHDTVAWAMRAGPRPDLRFNNAMGLQDIENMVASTLILRKLLENERYRLRFVTQMHELLDTKLHPDRVMQVFEEVHAVAEPDLEREWARWPMPDGARARYEQDLERIRTFIRERPAIVREHLARAFPDPGAQRLR
jgi:hypothetical protein